MNVKMSNEVNNIYMYFVYTHHRQTECKQYVSQTVHVCQTNLTCY
jgi:hypothetical protein